MIYFEWLKGIVVFLLMISVLVAAHEYGHYLFARIFKMGVEEFAIGFGPKVAVWRRKKYRVSHGHSNGTPPEAGASDPGAQEEETEYTLRMLPLGGFVRIKGMVIEEDGRETKVLGGFYSKAPWKRILVLFAGPAFSVIAGVLAYTAMFFANGIDYPTTTIRDVLPDSPAYTAGLKANDTITAVDGVPLKNFFDMVTTLQSKADVETKLTIDRGGKSMTVSIVPLLTKEAMPVFGPDGSPTGEMRRRVKLGILAMSEQRPASLGLALRLALDQPKAALTNIKEIFSGKQKAADSAAGPIGILAATKDATESGLWTVVSFAAILSISVGILNLLPCWPFDGGQILVALAEMLRGGRRLSLRVQNAFMSLGFAMVLVLFFSVTFIDIRRLLHPKPDTPVQFSTK